MSTTSGHLGVCALPLIRGCPSLLGVWGFAHFFEGVHFWASGLLRANGGGGDVHLLICRPSGSGVPSNSSACTCTHVHTYAHEHTPNICTPIHPTCVRTHTCTPCTPPHPQHARPLHANPQHTRCRVSCVAARGPHLCISAGAEAHVHDTATAAPLRRIRNEVRRAGSAPPSKPLLPHPRFGLPVCRCTLECVVVNIQASATWYMQVRKRLFWFVGGLWGRLECVARENAWV